MREVTKAEFHHIYRTLGRGEGGWTDAYWEQFFEHDPHPDMKYQVEDPKSESHTSMNLVSDFAVREYRLFFLTDDDQDSFMEWPDTGDE